jgi:putative ABC transport system permease protein
MTNPLAEAVRRCTRSPGFSLAVLALVALAVFVNTTAFATLWTLRFKALPFPEGDRLVAPQADLAAFGVVTGLTGPLRDALRARTEVFDAVAGHTAARPQRDPTTRIDWRIARTTPDLLPLLGAQPVLGRMPAADEADAVLLSQAAWTRHFGGAQAPGAQVLRVGGRELRVVGVMADGFAFPDRRTDAWQPMTRAEETALSAPNGNVGDLDVVARLAPGVGLAQAREVLAAALATDPSLEALRTQGGLAGVVSPLREIYAADSRAALAALAVAAALLLAVAAFNLGSLLLERVSRRERELAVRRALGAGRRALLLAAAGDLSLLTALGALLGVAALPLGVALLQRAAVLPPELPLAVGLDGVVLAAGGALALLLVAGALAVGALGSVRRIADSALNAPLAVRGFGRLRGGLLVAQLALTTVLLGGGLLLLRSTANLLAEDTGFDRRQVLLANIDLETDPGAAREALVAQATTLRERLAALPGVAAVGQVNLVPFSGAESVNASSWDDGEPPRRARSRLVSPGYFEAMGVPLQQGRGFIDADASDPGGVVVVDALFAERHLRAGEAVGSSVRMPTERQDVSRPARVVGVARTIRHGSLDERTDLPTLYEFGADPLQLSWYVVRAAGDPAALAGDVRSLVERVAPAARIGLLLPLGELVERSVRQRQATARAVAVFGGATLALAVLGLYAALAFAFQRRRQELALRLALGARPASLVRLVLRQGLVLGLLALPPGILAGVLLAGQQAPLLHQLGPGDPATWAFAAVGVLVAVAAAALPAALRASRVAPQAALRAD